MERLDLTLEEAVSFIYNSTSHGFETLITSARDWNGIRINLNSAEEARNLRRKLYRARVKMKAGELKEFAFQLTFKINGSSVELIPPIKASISSLASETAPAPAPATTEDSVNVSENQSPTTSDN